VVVCHKSAGNACSREVQKLRSWPCISQDLPVSFQGVKVSTQLHPGFRFRVDQADNSTFKCLGSSRPVRGYAAMRNIKTAAWPDGERSFPAIVHQVGEQKQCSGSRCAGAVGSHGLPGALRVLLSVIVWPPPVSDWTESNSGSAEPLPSQEADSAGRRRRLTRAVTVTRSRLAR